MPKPIKTKLGEDDRASKFEGRLKADAGTEQAPLKVELPPSLRHGAARATGARRSVRRDRATIMSCSTGYQRKASGQEVRGYLLGL